MPFVYEVLLASRVYCDSWLCCWEDVLEKVLSVRKWADRCVPIYLFPNHSEENEKEIGLWLPEKWRSKQN